MNVHDMVRARIERSRGLTDVETEDWVVMIFVVKPGQKSQTRDRVRNDTAQLFPERWRAAR